jgi:hypothetical protein
MIILLYVGGMMIGDHSSLLLNAPWVLSGTTREFLTPLMRRVGGRARLSLPLRQVSAVAKGVSGGGDAVGVCTMARAC